MSTLGNCPTVVGKFNAKIDACDSEGGIGVEKTIKTRLTKQNM